MSLNTDSSQKRVVITGLGIVSAIGIGKEAYWDSLRAARSGVRKITSFDVSSYPCQIAAGIENFDPIDFMPTQVARRVDRFAQLAVAAARLAVSDGYVPTDGVKSSELGVILGTSVGTLCYAEQQIALFYEKGVNRINPFFATSVIPSSALTQITLNLGIHGPSHTITVACASGTAAIGEAFQQIRDGKLKVILAGGSEAPITPLVVSTLSSVQLLSVANSFPQTAYRPFSKNASGFVLGEGAAILVVEELEHALNRDAHIYAEIVGFGMSCDAYHVMSYAPGFEHPVAAIHAAMRVSGLHPEDLDYINPHGIAVPDNDRSETAIFKMALGDAAAKVPISATKPLTGHTLGAGGALELVACCMMLQNEYLHPTVNLLEPDPLCDLDFIPNEGRIQKVNNMLSVSFGFGGYNAACVIRRYEE